jgi:hypothetical protein
MKKVLIIGCSLSAGEWGLNNKHVEHTVGPKGWYYYVKCLNDCEITVASFPGRGYTEYAAYVTYLYGKNELDFDAIIIQESMEPRIFYDAEFDPVDSAKYRRYDLELLGNIKLFRFYQLPNAFTLRYYSDVLNIAKLKKIPLNSPKYDMILIQSHSVQQIILNAKLTIEVLCEKKNIPMYAMSFGNWKKNTVLNYCLDLGKAHVFHRVVEKRGLQNSPKKPKRFYHYHQSKEGNIALGEHVNNLLKNYF